MSYTTSLPPANAHFISTNHTADLAARYRKNRKAIVDTAYKY